MTKIKVGAFLALGILVLVVSVFMLGSNKSIFQNSYSISTYFDSVQGLNNGAVVSLAGVKIGNVESIEYDQDKNLVQVVFLMDSTYAKKIKTDSIVEIRTQGALGDKFLYITPGTAGEPVQNRGELKAEYGNDILAVLSKRGNESEKLFDTINNLNSIVKGLAEQNKLPSLINKLDQAAGNLNESSVKIKQAFAGNRLEKSMVKMDNILEKIDNGQGTLGALINDRSIHDRLKSILGAGQKQQQVKSIIKSSVEE
ncbi:MlaD family protein [Pseudobdellovibrio sp. HCB154]|uniref:MlaD family protein n=1 Tax=Pseudobdellovibrio sp. HCB154 TaxID=3386277 RepID=UPI003916E2D7